VEEKKEVDRLESEDSLGSLPSDDDNTNLKDHAIIGNQ
jgi:hypothetical protein